MTFKAPAQVDERRTLEAFRSLETELKQLSGHRPLAVRDLREKTTVRPRAGDLVRAASGQSIVLPAARPSSGQTVMVAVESTPAVAPTVTSEDGLAVLGTTSLSAAGLYVYASTGVVWCGT